MGEISGFRINEIMNFKHLHTFLQVADMKSLSRAAIALDTAQSLVSRQVALLEGAWGRRLFDRTGRGMVLSEFGQRMYPEMQITLISANEATPYSIMAYGMGFRKIEKPITFKSLETYL